MEKAQEAVARIAGKAAAATGETQAAPASR
jgi:hypothetical protein